MNLPTVTAIIPRLYEDDVESDFIRDSMLSGLLDENMSDAKALAMMLLFERVPVCVTACFEVP